MEHLNWETSSKFAEDCTQQHVWKQFWKGKENLVSDLLLNQDPNGSADTLTATPCLHLHKLHIWTFLEYV